MLVNMLTCWGITTVELNTSSCAAAALTSLWYSCDSKNFLRLQRERLKTANTIEHAHASHLIGAATVKRALPS